MTDPKPRAKRGTAALSPGLAADSIRQLLSTQRDRLTAAEQEIIDVDIARIAAVIARVPDADRGVLRKMLASVGVELPPEPVIDAEFRDPAVDGDDVGPDDEHDEESDAGIEYGTISPQIEAEFPKTNVVPDRLRDPLPESRLKVGRR